MLQEEYDLIPSQPPHRSISEREKALLIVCSSPIKTMQPLKSTIIETPRLSTLRSNLHGSTLCLLLASNSSSGLTLRSLSSTLCLLSLLLAFLCSLLLLSFLDGGLTSCTSGFWSLRSSFFDDVERCTNNGTVGLDSTASSFLGNFLLSRRLSVRVQA